MMHIEDGQPKGPSELAAKIDQVIGALEDLEQVISQMEGHLGIAQAKGITVDDTPEMLTLRDRRVATLNNVADRLNRATETLKLIAGELDGF
jgi:hypothetical protein